MCVCSVLVILNNVLGGQEGKWYSHERKNEGNEVWTDGIFTENNIYYAHITAEKSAKNTRKHYSLRILKYTSNRPKYAETIELHIWKFWNKNEAFSCQPPETGQVNATTLLHVCLPLQQRMKFSGNSCCQVIARMNVIERTQNHGGIRSAASATALPLCEASAAAALHSPSHSTWMNSACEKTFQMESVEEKSPLPQPLPSFGFSA